MIRKILLLFVLFFFLMQVSYCAPINGSVAKNGEYSKNRVVDARNGAPISNAKIRIPSKQYSTMSRPDGTFELQADITGPTIMSVEKDGYKPFSLTMDKSAFSKPVVIGIEKSNPADIVVEQNLLHLGDNSFSENSANAGEFRIESSGPFFTKKIKIPLIKNFENAYFVIGSVIGIDTKMAIDLGQSKVQTAYSSPPEIYFNNNKIADLKINGDNQEIKLPKNLIRTNALNEITVRTGRNLFQKGYIDYDDIEMMNLSVTVH